MGLKVLLDTNAIIALLRGKYNVIELINKADHISISVISKLEFLAFEGLTEKDKTVFLKFCERIHIYELSSNDDELLNLIITIKKKYKLKLPDAIIAATAIIYDATLITIDKDFSKIQGLKVQF
ncbi:MAG: PIN domain-containing protein [Saprospiraceae bacterium]